MGGVGRGSPDHTRFGVWSPPGICPAGLALVAGRGREGSCAYSGPGATSRDPLGPRPIVGSVAKGGTAGGGSPFFGVALRQICLLGLPEAVLGPCALLDPLSGHCHVQRVFRVI